MASIEIIKEELIDNKYGMLLEKAEPYIKDLVAEKMPMFNLVKEDTVMDAYYYYFIFGYKDYEITIGGERGALEYRVKKGGEVQFDFYHSYPDLKKLFSAGKANIGLLINVYVDYFKQKGIL